VTDTRLPEHYLTSPTLDALTSDAFRVYVNSLIWSNAHGTDGVLPTRALRLLHPDGTRHDLADELVAVGLLEQSDDGYTVRDFLTYQSSAKSVETARELARDRKRRQREREQEEALSRVTDPVTSRGTSRGRPEDRTGTGQDSPKGDRYVTRGTPDDKDDWAGLHAFGTAS